MFVIAYQLLDPPTFIIAALCVYTNVMSVTEHRFFHFFMYV